MALRIRSLSCWSRPPSVSASVHHAHQLLLGDAVVVLGAAEHPVQQLLPLGEQEVQRRQHHQPAPAAAARRPWPRPPARSLARLLGVTSPKIRITTVSTAADTVGPLALPMQLDKQHRADGGGRVVDDVVADEDGGEQPVVIVRQGQGPGGALVAVVGPGFQADPVQGGKRRSPWRRNRRIGRSMPPAPPASRQYYCP